MDVAIVGAGASGTLVAVQLLRRAQGPLRIELIERKPRQAPGPAFSTPFIAHLLNVPAGKMSALPDAPDHFYEWARRRAPTTDREDFLPRSWYGEYLAELLGESVARAPQGVELRQASGEVVSLRRGSAGFVLGCRGGSGIQARAVVLALGNELPANLSVPEDGLYASPRYFRSPWTREATVDVQLREPVLLLGTGLTMVDTVLALRETGHRGEIHALSRHGFLPEPHRKPASPPAASPVSPTDGASVRRTLRALHAAAGELGPGQDWRGVVDALRPMTQTLWRSWSDGEKARFLRHARAFWDVHRHRMAPEVAAAIEALRQEGPLQLHAGRVLRFRRAADQVEVVFRPRGERSERRLEVGRVINCTGPGAPGTRSDSPLVRALLTEGAARPDVLHLGLALSAEGELLDGAGEPYRDCWTLGSVRRGQLWESVAVAEIRVQAQRIAERLSLGPG